MRTTLDLPMPLMERAIGVSHQKTKTAVIIEALEEYVRKKRIQGIRKYKGRVNLDINLDVVRGRA